MAVDVRTREARVWPQTAADTAAAPVTNQSFTRAPRAHPGRRWWQGCPEDRASCPGYHQQVPLLLFCFLTSRREQTARRALAASTYSLGLRIATAAIDPRVICPAGQVWMPLHGSSRQVQLIDLHGNLFRAARSAYAADPYR